jgi:alkanesulfonate monooxygenase SsuD/methylene tetrahydromethanopterin reductase-like flavin-dependent oxidoreductase (luciferase family)
MAAPRRLHLKLNFLSAGSHAAAWLWPGIRPEAFVDPAYLVETARLAEPGTLDAIFLADHPSMQSRSDFGPFQALEPSIVLTAIAGATRHIGLIGTISSSCNAPYNIARRFASLDIISGGRA